MNRHISTNTQLYPRLALYLATATFLTSSWAGAQTQFTALSADQLAQIRVQRPQRILVANQAIDKKRLTGGLTIDDTFQHVSSTFDDAGGLHVRYVRRYKNLRVIGGGVKVNVNTQGSDGSIRHFKTLNVAVPSIVPTVNEAAMLQTVATDLGTFVNDLDSKQELVILPGGVETRDPRLAWMVIADAPDAEATHYFIDANSGAIISKAPAHVHNDDVTPGTGRGFHNGKVDITTRYSSAQNKYKLQDTTRGETLVYDVQDKKPTSSFHGDPYWKTTNDWANGADWKLGDSTTGLAGQSAAVDAFHRAARTWDLLKKVYQREGLNDDNQPMKLRVHVRKKKNELYGDAHWDGYFANFGDGKTSDSSHLATRMIVAHELGHGLWTHTVNDGNNKGEARGLNEGTGDILASLVHHYTELADSKGSIVPTNRPREFGMFESRSINALGYQNSAGDTGLRWYMPNMKDYEEHVQGTVYGKMFATLAMGAPSQAEYDAGSPCTANSGRIFNCLMSPFLQQGMAGIGMDKAGKIWYRATTAKFPEEPTFSSTRADFLEAAADLHGLNSREYKSVMNAFRAINVGDEATDTGNPTISITLPVIDKNEESMRLAVYGNDDIGVKRIDLSFPGSSISHHWDDFIGYMSMASTTPGTWLIQATAHDAKGKQGNHSRQFTHTGANFLIQNRGFESGSASWTSSSTDLFKNDARHSFLGSRYVSFKANSSIRQQFTVPAGVDSCKVGYRVRVVPNNFEESDNLLVELMNANGTSVLSTLNSISPELNTTDLESNHYKRYTHEIPGCSGQTRGIRFRTTNTSADRFRIDNVFVVYEADVKANFNVTVDEGERTVIFEVKNIQNIAADQIGHVGFNSPGLLPVNDPSAPYVIIKSTSDFVLNANYNVQASIVDVAGATVYTSPAVPFLVKEVNQLLNNPGMESSGLWWTNTGSTAWCQAPGAGEGALGFVGIGCANMLGNGTVYQQVAIPSGPGQAELTFRLNIIQGTGNQDLKVRVENVNTGVSTILDTIPGTENTNAGISHKGYRKYTFNLAPYLGQTVRIKFQTTNNSGSPMQFLIDNAGVTYKAYGFAGQ